MLFVVFICRFPLLCPLLFFFFNDTATTEIYTLSLHDALPISGRWRRWHPLRRSCLWDRWARDRKSTRLNSSHLGLSYAVFCLKKKTKRTTAQSIDNKNQRSAIISNSSAPP